MESGDRFKHLDGKQLKAKISAREKQINQILQFATLVVPEHGVTVKLELRPFNVHMVTRLNNFGGFDFVLDTGQSEMGGNDLKVYVNSKLVLAVYWQCGINDCQVEVFDKSADWQSKLQYVISHKDKIIAKTKNDEKIVQRQRCSAVKHFDERTDLLEAAERLKL